MKIMTLMLAMTPGSRSEMTESGLLHPIDNIYTSINSWIITTALDFDLIVLCCTMLMGMLNQ